MHRKCMILMLIPILCLLCSCQRDVQSSLPTPSESQSYDIDTLRQFSDYATERQLSNAVIGELVNIWGSLSSGGGLSESQRTVAAHYYRLLSVDHRRRAFLRSTKCNEIDVAFRGNGAQAVPGGYILAAKCTHPGRYMLPHSRPLDENQIIIEMIVAIMPDAGISIPERLLLSSGSQDLALTRVNFDQGMSVGFINFRHNFYQCANHAYRDRWIAPILNNGHNFINPLAANSDPRLPNLAASRADYPLIASVLYMVDGNVAIGESARVSGMADCITLDPKAMTDGVKYIIDTPDIIAHHYSPSFTDQSLGFSKTGKALFKHDRFAFEIPVRNPVGPETQLIIQYPKSDCALIHPRSITIRGTRVGDHLMIPITVTGTVTKHSFDALFDTGASRVCLPLDMSKHFIVTDNIAVSTANGDIMAQCSRAKVSTGNFERDVSIVFIPGQQALLGASFLSGAKYTVDINNAEIIIVE